MFPPALNNLSESLLILRYCQKIGECGTVGTVTTEQIEAQDQRAGRKVDADPRSHDMENMTKLDLESAGHSLSIGYTLVIS